MLGDKGDNKKNKVFSVSIAKKNYMLFLDFIGSLLFLDADHF